MNQNEANQSPTGLYHAHEADKAQRWHPKQPPTVETHRDRVRRAYISLAAIVGAAETLLTEQFGLPPWAARRYARVLFQRSAPSLSLREWFGA